MYKAEGSVTTEFSDTWPKQSVMTEPPLLNLLNQLDYVGTYVAVCLYHIVKHIGKYGTTALAALESLVFSTHVGNSTIPEREPLSWLEHYGKLLFYLPTSLTT